MSDRDTQVALAFIAAMGEGDAAAADPLLAPDAIAVTKGFGKIGGTRDRATTIGNLGSFKQLMPTGLRPTILSVTADGERVAVEFEGNAVTAAGEPYCNQYCMVFEMQDGLIRVINEYFCTILADQRIWPLVSDATAEPTSFA